MAPESVTDDRFANVDPRVRGKLRELLRQLESPKGYRSGTESLEDLAMVLQQTVQYGPESLLSAVDGANSPVIDCSVRPFIPEGCVLLPEDQIVGPPLRRLILDRIKISWHRLKHEDHPRANSISGICYNILTDILKDRLPLPANLLDFYLAHPDKIPPEFGDGRDVAFFGHIYRCRRRGDKFVRCLSSDKDGWNWFRRDLWLDWTHFTIPLLG